MQTFDNKNQYWLTNTFGESKNILKNLWQSLALGLVFLLLSISNYAQESGMYKTDAFNKVVLNRQQNVVLVNSDSCYVLVKTKDYNPEKFSFEIKDKKIRFRIKGLKNKNIKLEIGAPEFTEITMSGVGDVKCLKRLEGQKLYIELSGATSAVLDLDYKKLTARLSGASDAVIKGFADSIYVHTSGASEFNSFNAKSIYASVQASGASDVGINADSMVVADMSGASSLRYKKEPKHKLIGKNKSVWKEKSKPEVYVSENNDTIRLVAKEGQIKIIISEDGDFDIDRLDQKFNNRFTGNWAGVELGINGYLNSNLDFDMPSGYEFLELNYGKSMNFNLNFFQQSFNIIGNKFGFVTGLGVRWLNYRFDDDVFLEADSTVIYGYHDKSTDRSYVKSKLTACYLVLPLVFEIQSRSNHSIKSFHLAAGVIGGLKLTSHTKRVYNVDGKGEYRPKVFDDFHLQPFTLDATVRLGWGPLNLYANYSLIEMFRKNRGPEIYPFAVGLIFPLTK